MALHLPPGTTIERYRIEQAIGAGSMGDVFRGIDIDLKRRVAIKILSERHRDNRELHARFLREARAVAAISHPNVVQVYATGLYDNRPYIAMELLDGTDLGSSVEQRGAWPSVEAAKAIRDAALGLEGAARAGLIHRDVKPANLVMLQSGVVKVTDFGLAKPTEPDDEPALTAMGVVVGTPDYIAPEQARGDPIDERVDIYALGGTLYFLLAGRPPFRTGIPNEDKYLKVVARHLKQAAPDACARNPSADPELAQLAQLMMAKRPDERPGYAVLIEQLNAVIDRLEGRRSTSTLSGRQVSPLAGDMATAATAPAGYPRIATHHEALGRNAGPGENAPPRAATAVTGRQAAPLQGPVAPLDQRGQVSRILISITAGSIALFLVGLVLMLLGSGSSAVVVPPVTPPPIDAGAPKASVIPVDAALPKKQPLSPPEGMVLIHKEDGSPWFFAAARPVTRGEYAAVFPDQKDANPRRDDKLVTSVSYQDAEAYATAKKGRLLTAAEWEAAAKNQAFVASEYWEWVAEEASPTEAGSVPGPGPGPVKDEQKKPVRSSQGKDLRRTGGSRDITFRIGASIE